MAIRAPDGANNVKTKPIIKSKTNTKSSNDIWPLKILNLIPNQFFAKQQPTDDHF